MQELITGDNSIEKLPGLVANHGKGSVFIITGQHFVKKADELFAGKLCPDKRTGCGWKSKHFL